MTKNKDSRSGNLTGFLDYDADTITSIKKDKGEKVYSLSNFLKQFDGLEVSITATVDSDIQPLDE